MASVLANTYAKCKAFEYAIQLFEMLESNMASALMGFGCLLEF